MKAWHFVCVLLLLLATSCSPSSVETGSPQIPETPQTKPCGDGTCKGPENSNNCPQDCADTPAVITPPSQDDPIVPSSTEPVLLLGIMVHLEGWGDFESQDAFTRHIGLMREYADLFERYGAKLTWESKEVTEGIEAWGDNVLLEMEGRGHGIGVHADLGGLRNYNCNRFADELRRERIQLEALGVIVRHVSGTVSHCDWVQATIQAGYSFSTGQVAYGLMSLPEEDRPPEYSDCPDPSECHQTYPEDLSDRLVPWRTSTGSDWLTHDPDGDLVLLSASQGLTCIQEELEGELDKGCTFDVKDIEFFEEELLKAIDLMRPDQVNIHYLGWSLGGPLDQELLETWLQVIEPYVEAGQVAWATLPEMYDAYVAWEQGGS